ncbi:hypothetical protein [Arthrobacter sp. OAP107]|uniref:AlbA family DNA-binding domain-containing protein n=1 Tax=Arthrobacter sp. OAP107 TaxID=3156445 RepID=UPI00339B6B54
MRAIDLEARVISAVDRIRAGQQVENDHIECKRTWPQDSKARQLAGSLNRAGGDPVVYIIGIDENTAQIHDVSGTDIHDWWSQITPKFDQIPPEMVRHISVPVGEDGEHVVAVAFASDRAPYVVKTGSPNPSLEVPMREGTGTRTARRDELLRLLIPAVRLPQIVVLEARLHGEYFPPAQLGKSTEELTCSGQIKIYVEHNGHDIVTLPAHGMRGKVTIEGEKYDLDIKPPSEHATVPTGTQTFGYQRPSDGVTLTGPRAVPLQLNVRGLTPQQTQSLVQADALELDIALEVLHSISPLKIHAVLDRDGASNVGVSELDGIYSQSWTPGSWCVAHPGLPFDD